MFFLFKLYKYMTYGLWVGLSLLIISLQACGGNSQKGEITFDDDKQFFLSGYKDIDKYYIDDPDFQTISLAALGKLSALDANLSLEQKEGQVVLKKTDTILLEDKIPGTHKEDKWASLTTKAFMAMYENSSVLQKMPREDLYEIAYSGIMTKLDPYSHYASALIAADNRASRDGFGGIGVKISVQNGMTKIVSVMHYTPAERAGLKINDVILEIDGIPINNLKNHEIIRKLRGSIDSNVTLKIQRPFPENIFEVKLRRMLVIPETVSYKRQDDIGYIHIYNFNLETTESLLRAIYAVKNENQKPLKGIVLDVRSNPGGLLDQAVSVADLFLNSGVIVSTRGRHPDSYQKFEATKGDILDGLPIVVLINGNSASAAEIVAAALQDNKRAVVIGTNSYGKGTVQTVLTLPNQGELILTWAKFHAPSGYSLNNLGVLPAVCIRNSAQNIDQTAFDLKTGKLLSSPLYARSLLLSSDQTSLIKLRNLCPGRPLELETDVKMAEKIISDVSLYEIGLSLNKSINLGNANLVINTQN
ncbi:MAG: S41 family peptidase [Alphaproteobacteria bacterium]|nr:S41 family peptidase [Alphaproteobacteria bacterium]